MARPILVPILAAAVLAGPGQAVAQRFLPDDPVRHDRDDLHVPVPPAEVELSTTWDVIENTFGHGPGSRIPPAMGVNTLGEVPDSSWFEGRIGVRDIGVEELVRGPDTTGGPDVDHDWVVIGGKSSGITPGFTIRDARGDVYFVKFDPVAYPHLSSAADVVSTKFFHAFGYFVPQNYIAHFRRGQLRIAEGTRLTVKGEGRRAMTEADLDEMLARVPRSPDGSYRCVASLGLAGTPLGPHKYHGTRPDDPNDVFPHEHRRDLRGLRVFSAWLNHDDSRSINSLDMFVTEAGRSWVKHHLIDFGSTLGTGSDAYRRIAPQNPRAGNEYVVEWGPIVKTALSLGLWERPWRRVEYRVYPEVGRFEADFFEPHAWKPEYPNPAFERMLPEDALWAARIVARFSDEAIRAIVHVGEYSDPEAERYLADTLIRRRDKVAERYLSPLAPLSGFRVEGHGHDARLVFDNDGERAGLGRVEAYAHEWFVFDNFTEASTPLAPARRSPEASLPVPQTDAEFLRVRIRSHAAGRPGWAQPVDVYLRREPGGLQVVGVERTS